MSTMNTHAKQRVQFDFSQEALRRLETIQERVDASTKAEVIRNALRIYEWFASEINSDDVLEVQNKEGKVKFRIPAKVLLS